MTTDEKFLKFHSDNPYIFQLFVKYSREAKAAGKKHYGIWAIANRIRWHVDIETRSRDGFKVNNNYLSRYARLIAEEYPEFKGFFRNRELKGE